MIAAPGVKITPFKNVDLCRFSTAYYDEATLDDIYDAGLVTEDQVRDLEQGVISESDLYEQLKPYLFGGEEPVAGVILEDTGNIRFTLSKFPFFFTFSETILRQPSSQMDRTSLYMLSRSSAKYAINPIA